MKAGQHLDNIQGIATPAADKPDPRNGSRPGARFFQGRSRSVVGLATDKDDELFRSFIVSEDTLSRWNPLSTVASLTIQALLIAVLSIVPLFHPDPLPKLQRAVVVRLEAPPLPLTPKVRKIQSLQPAHTVVSAKAAASSPIPGPQQAHPLTSDPTPAVLADVVDGSSDGGAPRISGGTPSEPLPVKPADPTPVKRIRVAAKIAEANLIHDVPPEYPPEAGRERIQGTVVLLAVIGIDGVVKDVQVESGPPLLTQSAIEAVKQWRYKPYLLNGVPVEIDSRIIVNFTMSRG